MPELRRSIVSAAHTGRRTLRWLIAAPESPAIEDTSCSQPRTIPPLAHSLWQPTTPDCVISFFLTAVEVSKHRSTGSANQPSSGTFASSLMTTSPAPGRHSAFALHRQEPIFSNESGRPCEVSITAQPAPMATLPVSSANLRPAVLWARPTVPTPFPSSSPAIAW